MKEINLNLPVARPHKIAGTFTVELALIAAVISLLLAFTGDIVVKLSMKGKLDRLSFSAVSIIKERTQLYEGIDTLSQSDVDTVFTIIGHSLGRTTGNYEASRFSGYVEEQLYNGTNPDTAKFYVPFTPEGETPILDCRPKNSIDTIRDEVGVVTGWGRNARLYRVTLCYETGSWYGKIINSDEFNHVSSTAVIIGR